MLDKELIRRKMSLIDTYTFNLEDKLKQNTIADILSDEVLLAFIERRFQLIIDTMLDINTHIISEQNIEMPDNYQNTFIALGEHKIIPVDFAFKLAPAVGLRNHVVHKYEKLDLKLFLNNLNNNISDFRIYLKEIDFYLNSLTPPLAQ